MKKNPVQLKSSRHFFMSIQQKVHPDINILMVLIIAVFLTTSARAEKAEKGLFSSQDLGACFHPLGLVLETKLFYRFPMSDRDGILWESTKLDVGLHNEWTPADDFIGARICIEPVAFFDFVFKIGFYGMYDLFGYGFYGFDSSNAQYSDKALEKLNPATVPGCLIIAVPTLKLQLKSIICVNSFTLSMFMMKEKGYFLEVRSYTLHKTTDVDFQNDTYLMFEFNDKIMAGAMFRVQRVFATAAKTERICLIGVLQPRTKRLHDAAIAALAGMYIRDPLYYHSPYIGLNFGIMIKHKGN